MMRQMRIQNLQRPLYLAADFNCQLLQKRSETNKSMRAGDDDDDDWYDGYDDEVIFLFDFYHPQ